MIVDRLVLQRAERRLFRRSGDEAADRAIRLKLGIFPAEQLRNNVDDCKQPTFENVNNEQARVKACTKHITLQFWQGLIEKHQLVGSVCDSMQAPTAEEPGSKQFNACVQQAHIANPAQTTSLPLVKHMGFTAQPNATEFYGLCKACFESPSMTRPMSRVLCESILQMIARTRCDLAFPIYCGQLLHDASGLWAGLA